MYMSFFVTCDMSNILAPLIKAYDSCPQRLVVEMEQMASRPFATCNLEIDEAGPEASLFKKEPPDLRSSARWRKPGQNPHIQPSPVALEPLARQKAAVLTLVLRLPTGDDEFAPPGQTGIIMGSALVSLGISSLPCSNNMLQIQKLQMQIFHVSHR